MTGFTTLLDGYRRFRNQGYATQRARWDALSQGQSPRVMVIACSDSRVDPATVFDVSPGEIFVVRNVANLVPPFERGGGRHGVSAAVEFAVTQLEVSEIVVMGHASCGGVGACLSRRFANKAPGEGGFINDWMSILEPARDAVVAEHGTGPDAALALEHAGVRTSIANLRSFPFVPPREAAGGLRIHGAYFSIGDGTLHVMDDAGTFAAA